MLLPINHKKLITFFNYFSSYYAIWNCLLSLIQYHLVRTKTHKLQTVNSSEFLVFNFLCTMDIIYIIEYFCLFIYIIKETAQSRVTN